MNKITNKYTYTYTLRARFRTPNGALSDWTDVSEPMKSYHIASRVQSIIATKEREGYYDIIRRRVLNQQETP